jgi:hypothetical protein
MFFIAHGGRNYRRLVYRKFGIPNKIWKEIKNLRSAQCIRLTEKFCGTRAGAEIYAQAEKLWKEHKAILERFSKLEKPDKAMQKELLAKGVEMMEASYQYAETLSIFANRQDGLYNSTTKTFSDWANKAHFELVKARQLQQRYKA